MSGLYTAREVIDVLLCDPDSATFGYPTAAAYKGRKFKLERLAIDDVKVNMRELKRFCKMSAVAHKIKCYQSRNVPPIIVDERHEIIDGHHRLYAQMKMGKKTIRAFVMQKRR
jgi:hypothetical protein